MSPKDPDVTHYIDIALRVEFDPARLLEIISMAQRLKGDNPRRESALSPDGASSFEEAVYELFRSHPALPVIGMKVVEAAIDEEQTLCGGEIPPALRLGAEGEPEFEPSFCAGLSSCHDYASEPQTINRILEAFETKGKRPN